MLQIRIHHHHEIAAGFGNACKKRDFFAKIPAEFDDLPFAIETGCIPRNTVIRAAVINKHHFQIKIVAILDMSGELGGQLNESRSRLALV